MNLLQETISQIEGQDAEIRAKALARLEKLTMPHWALGRLMDLSLDLAGITRSLRPSLKNKTVVTMAGDHGVAVEKVSLFPKEVTAQMVLNFVRGGAGINALARLAGAKVVVVDMGIAVEPGDLGADGHIVHKRIGAGTRNIAQGPAMDRQEAICSLEAGIAVARDLASFNDLFGTGEMGIANTTPSSAIVATFTGKSVEEVTGRGTGIDDRQRARKMEVIKKSLEINRPDPKKPIEALEKVGGFEIGGIAGLILGAAAVRKPILVDGFISAAGALIAQALAPKSAEFMIAAHQSVEPGHQFALQHLGKEPLLNLGLRLGEGTGAALAMHLVEAAGRILTDIATFEEAGVSKA